MFEFFTIHDVQEGQFSFVFARQHGSVARGARGRRGKVSRYQDVLGPIVPSRAAQVRPEGKHRHGRLPEDPLGHRTYKRFAQSATAMCANHDEVNPLLLGEIQDGLGHVAFQQIKVIVLALNVRMRAVQFVLQLLQVATGSVLGSDEGLGAGEKELIARNDEDHVSLGAIGLGHLQTEVKGGVGVAGKVCRDEHILNAHPDRRELRCGHAATILPTRWGRCWKLCPAAPVTGSRKLH